MSQIPNRAAQRKKGSRLNTGEDEFDNVNKEDTESVAAAAAPTRRWSNKAPASPQQPGM